MNVPMYLTLLLALMVMAAAQTKLAETRQTKNAAALWYGLQYARIGTLVILSGTLVAAMFGHFYSTMTMTIIVIDLIVYFCLNIVVWRARVLNLTGEK